MRDTADALAVDFQLFQFGRAGRLVRILLARTSPRERDLYAQVAAIDWHTCAVHRSHAAHAAGWTMRQDSDGVHLHRQRAVDREFTVKTLVGSLDGAIDTPPGSRPPDAARYAACTAAPHLCAIGARAHKAGADCFEGNPVFVHQGAIAMAGTRPAFGSGARSSESMAEWARSKVCRWIALLIVAAIAHTSSFGSLYASTIYGTLSNFDIYNTTPEPSEGAEIELEDIHASSISRDFPAHYANRTITEYSDGLGNFAGTRITYTGYNFAGHSHAGFALAQSASDNYERTRIDLYRRRRAFRFLVEWCAADGRADFSGSTTTPEPISALAVRPNWCQARPGLISRRLSPEGLLCCVRKCKFPNPRKSYPKGPIQFG